MAEEIVEEVVVEPVVTIDPLQERDEKIAKVEQERDNYKAVALKRLGKLPGDADFLGDGELSVAEQVRLALLDREIESEKKARDEDTRKILKENSELRLLVKNRPQGSIGGEGGTIVEVKDNVFTESQLAELRKKAIALKADPEKFIERAKQNIRNKS